MDDDIDIYADLSINGSKEEDIEEKKEDPELIKKLTTLEEEVTKLRTQNETLARNLSSLLKTAQAEINRKDTRINELRKQLDNVAFRRGHFNPYYNKTYEKRFQKGQNGKQYHDPCVQPLPANQQNYQPTDHTEFICDSHPHTDHEVQHPNITTQPSLYQVKEESNEEEETEQKYNPDQIKMTLYGERLRQKLLKAEEEEQRAKEELKNPLADQKDATLKKESQDICEDAENATSKTVQEKEIEKEKEKSKHCDNKENRTNPLEPSKESEKPHSISAEEYAARLMPLAFKNPIKKEEELAVQGVPESRFHSGKNIDKNCPHDPRKTRTFVAEDRRKIEKQNLRTVMDNNYFKHQRDGSADRRSPSRHKNRRYSPNRKSPEKYRHLKYKDKPYQEEILRDKHNPFHSSHDPNYKNQRKFVMNRYGDSNFNKKAKRRGFTRGRFCNNVREEHDRDFNKGKYWNRETKLRSRSKSRSKSPRSRKEIWREDKVNIKYNDRKGCESNEKLYNDSKRPYTSLDRGFHVSTKRRKTSEDEYKVRSDGERRLISPEYYDMIDSSDISDIGSTGGVFDCEDGEIQSDEEVNKISTDHNSKFQKHILEEKHLLSDRRIDSKLIVTKLESKPNYENDNKQINNIKEKNTGRGKNENSVKNSRKTESQILEHQLDNKNCDLLSNKIESCKYVNEKHSTDRNKSRSKSRSNSRGSSLNKEEIKVKNTTKEKDDKKKTIKKTIVTERKIDATGDPCMENVKNDQQKLTEKPSKNKTSISSSQSKENEKKELGDNKDQGSSCKRTCESITETSNAEQCDETMKIKKHKTSVNIEITNPRVTENIKNNVDCKVPIKNKEIDTCQPKSVLSKSKESKISEQVNIFNNEVKEVIVEKPNSGNKILNQIVADVDVENKNEDLKSVDKPNKENYFEKNIEKSVLKKTNIEVDLDLEKNNPTEEKLPNELHCKNKKGLKDDELHPKLTECTNTNSQNKKLEPRSEKNNSKPAEVDRNGQKLEEVKNKNGRDKLEQKLHKLFDLDQSNDSLDKNVIPVIRPTLESLHKEVILQKKSVEVKQEDKIIETDNCEKTNKTNNLAPNNPPKYENNPKLNLLESLLTSKPPFAAALHSSERCHVLLEKVDESNKQIVIPVNAELFNDGSNDTDSQTKPNEFANRRRKSKLVVSVGKMNPKKECKLKKEKVQTLIDRNPDNKDSRSSEERKIAKTDTTAESKHKKKEVAVKKTTKVEKKAPIVFRRRRPMQLSNSSSCITVVSTDEDSNQAPLNRD